MGSTLVTVPKQRGEVLICAGYRVTVNPRLLMEHYRLPLPEALFTNMTGCKSCTALDLKSAHRRLPLKRDACRILAVSSHRGLFQFMRLPFRVSSAPAIFIC